MSNPNQVNSPTHQEWEILFQKRPLLLLANYSIERGLVSPGIISSIFSHIQQTADTCFKVEEVSEIQSYYRRIHKALTFQPPAEDPADSAELDALESISYEEFETEALGYLKKLLIDFDEFSNHSYSNEIISCLFNLGCDFDPLESFNLQGLDPKVIEQILLPKLGQTSRNLLYYWALHPDGRRDGLGTEHIAYLLNHSGVEWLTGLSPTDMSRVSNQVRTFVSEWEKDPFYYPLVTLLERKSGLESEEGQGSVGNQVELAGFPIQSKYPDSRPVVLSKPNYQGATHLEDLPILTTKDLELEVRLFESVDGDKLLCIELYSDTEHFELIKFNPLQSSVRFLTDYDVPVAWINFEEDKPVYIDIVYKVGTFKKVEMLMISLEE